MQPTESIHDLTGQQWGKLIAENHAASSDTENMSLIGELHDLRDALVADLRALRDNVTRMQ